MAPLKPGFVRYGRATLICAAALILGLLLSPTFAREVRPWYGEAVLCSTHECVDMILPIPLSLDECVKRAEQFLADNGKPDALFNGRPILAFEVWCVEPLSKDRTSKLSYPPR